MESINFVQDRKFQGLCVKMVKKLLFS